MAPTICTEEKEARIRGRIRDPRRRQLANLPVMNGVNHADGNIGKIVHRRSTVRRNLSSSPLLMSISESLIDEENNTALRLIEDSLNTPEMQNEDSFQSSLSSSSSSSLSSSSTLLSSSSSSISSPLNVQLMEEDNEENDEEDSSSSMRNAASSSSSSSLKSSALESSKRTLSLVAAARTISEYDSDFISSMNFDKKDICSINNNNNNKNNSNNYSKMDLIVLRSENFSQSFMNTDGDDDNENFNTTTEKRSLPTPVRSTSSSLTVMQSNVPLRRKNSKGLLEIAIKTIKLIRRNQLLQRKLSQLQKETREFIESVMANPENRALCDKLEQANKCNTTNKSSNIEKRSSYEENVL